jgi:hypothetical protein
MDVGFEYDYPQVPTTIALPALTRPVWVLYYNPSVRARGSELLSGVYWTCRVCEPKLGRSCGGSDSCWFTQQTLKCFAFFR